MTIGQRIKKARAQANLTQDDLAKLSGFSRSHIGAIELDRYHPSISTLMAIADALHQPVEYFVGEKALLLMGDGISSTPSEKDDSSCYYHDPEVARIAQEMHDNPDIKVLFDASRGLKKESIEEVRKFIEFQKAKELGDFD